MYATLADAPYEPLTEEEQEWEEQFIREQEAELDFQSLSETAPPPSVGDALRGTWSQDVDRLTWLSALVSDYQEAREEAPAEDPSATWTMLDEVQGLIADLRAAAAV